ncbi:MAG: hypothetical protein P8L32_03385 [Paracoccaceae bacterium]|nr:hypothetical protein [Paracoccaceae bacterium]
MPTYALLISPRAESAYFAQTLTVARAELSNAMPSNEIGELAVGSMNFLTLECSPDAISKLLRLSFVQGIFEKSVKVLSPIDALPEFNLHPDFVWGEKYRGKTNETLTQLLINLSLQAIPDATTLCDPMCGRGTTLLWAMRYGLKSTGIEQDPQALEDIQRGLKKWSKLHRQKHKLTQGWLQKTNKTGTGKYIDFSAEGTSLRLITGNTVDALSILQNKRFDILATDIPYGIQHMGGKSTRSPLETLADAAQGWVSALRPDGVLAIAFNNYMPKRADLLQLYSTLGMEEIPTNVSHRMSESIVRDILLIRKTNA